MDRIMQKYKYNIDETEKCFNDLSEKNDEIRLEAAKYFSWLARKEFNLFSKKIFEDINSYKRLYPILNDENPEIVCYIISALGAAYTRYREEQKIENELIKLFNSTNKKIILYTSIWTQLFENDEKYNYVINLLEKAKSKELIKALCGHFGINTNDNMKNKVQKILLQKLETIKNEYSIRVIIGVLLGIRNNDNIKTFKKYIEPKDNSFKEMVKWGIKIYIPEREMGKVLKELNIE
jgi:acetone carboxylase gamma subunit